MRNKTTTITVFALLVIGLSAATGCKPANKNPMDYNNKLMTIMNDNDQDMQAMNAAMTSGDYKKATDVRQSWDNHLETALREVSRLGSFKGDDSFQKTVLNGLKNYKRAVDNNYKKLIAIRSGGDGDQQAEERELLNAINDTFSRAGNTINKAATDFQIKYGK